GIADLFIHAESFDEIDVAFIGIGLDEVVAMAPDVAEVDIENLLARSEVADHVIDFLAGIGQHFGDGPLAEVQSVIFAFANRDELLQAIHRAEYGVDALIAFGRHTRIVRVAGHADLILVSDRDDAVQKVSNAFPVTIGVDFAGFGEGSLGAGFGQLPGAVHSVAAAGGALGQA